MKYTIREVFEEGSTKYLLYRYDEPAADPVPTNAEFEMWGEIEELQKKVAEQQELLNFFYGQMQMHSPNISAQHPWRFRSGGWPMNHCVGASRQDAAMNAVNEIRKEQPQLLCQTQGKVVIDKDTAERVCYLLNNMEEYIRSVGPRDLRGFEHEIPGLVELLGGESDP